MAIETKAGTGVSCWSCGAQRDEGAHFCPACGKVQPARRADHFAFFGLPRKLELDEAALEREFYRLSRKLHPDLYARAGAQEQQWSLEKSSQLNDAYRALKDPVTRTEHLLKLEGVELEEQSKAATDRARATGEEKKQVVPPDLLEEAFEFNLQLEELRTGRTMGQDDPDVVAELTAHRKHFEARLE
ncbi:MAG: Fe-S protein assembly co-chaperone HscB, partial [Terriglobales bacterium]